MTKPKIAIFIVNMAAGGAERVVSNILKHLSAEFEFHLILLNPIIQYDLPKDTIIHFLDNENLDKPTAFDKIRSLVRMPILAFALKKYCEKHQISTIFSLLSRPNYISCLLKMIQNDLYIVISQRSTVSSFYHTQGSIDRLNRYLTKLLYPKADLIVSNSKGIQTDLREKYGLKNATSTVYNPFDFEKIAFFKQEKIDLEGLNTEGAHFDKFTFVSVGRLNAVKNHPLLLQAFAALNDETTQLLIVGDAAQSRQDIPALARSLGIEKRVIFAGFQSNPFKFLSKSHCYVLSSDTEGFPNVLIEAIACGLPIISTDCQSGPREILAPQSDLDQTLLNNHIEKAELGILTPIRHVTCLTEAMSAMRNDAFLRQKYIEKSQKRLADFQLNNILSDFRDVFTQVAKN